MTDLSPDGKQFAMDSINWGLQWAFWRTHEGFFLPVLLGPAQVH